MLFRINHFMLENSPPPLPQLLQPICVSVPFLFGKRNSTIKPDSNEIGKNQIQLAFFKVK